MSLKVKEKIVEVEKSLKNRNFSIVDMTIEGVTPLMLSSRTSGWFSRLKPGLWTCEADVTKTLVNPLESRLLGPDLTNGNSL